MEDFEIKSQLPDNAFRELNEGEQYEPLMSPKGNYPEVNTWSVSWGILMAMLSIINKGIEKDKKEKQDCRLQ